MIYIFINNNFYLESEAKISVKDRGFRFGDGVFETLSFDNGEIYRWDLHKKRLDAGLNAIKIEYNSENLHSNIIKTFERNGLKSGSARVAITRGEGSRGYLPTNEKPCNVVIEVAEKLNISKKPVKICLSNIKKIPAECLPVSYKISQGLNSTLARMEAVEKGFFDCLMLNTKGLVAECSSSNIFWRVGNKIYTPSLECDILNGVMRQVVIEKLDNNSDYKLVECKAKPKALRKADEVFITNSSFKILPVEQIEGVYNSKDKNNFYKYISEKI
jgi:branched-chain amino acid aminotransferase